jgi:2-polyprenyl-6-methoxyphenol hydroxylase-like FAD-dependent oxidoreductase
MTAGRFDYDAVIVGASLGGCASAIHLARSGARVALVERRPDPAAFKRVCGHFVQASAVGALERLGLMPELEAAGAVRGRPRVWTPYGWIVAPKHVAGMESLSIRREVLDPLLRRRAAETPGVDLLLGHTLDRLHEGPRVELRRRAGTPVRLSARLVVGADGRGSRTAELAGVRTRTSRNDRFGYWGYFEGAGLGTGASVHIWFLPDGDVGIVTPTDAGLTLYVAFPRLERVPEFKADTEGALRAFVAALPEAPPIAEARLAGPLVGKLDLTNEWRTPARGRVALVGDAATAADPVGAIGCGWAVQSAEWLGTSLAPALAGDEPLARGLRRYRRRHRRELLGHSLAAASGSKAKPPNRLMRTIFSAAPHDPVTAERVEAFAARTIRPHQLMSPATLARAARVNARRRRSGAAPAARAA